MKINEVDIRKYETLLLDRDGTINVHIIGDYVRSWDDFEFIPNVVETIAKWSSQLKHIFIVTNQRGIGKGKYTENDLDVIHSHMDELGEITTSDERVNRLILNAKWGQKGNFVDIPTDCPQRDERMGWTGDTQVFSGTASFFTDTTASFIQN